MEQKGTAGRTDVTRVLADYVATARIDPQSRTVALGAVRDTIGCIIAALAEPEAAPLFATLTPRLPTGQCTVFGHQTPTDATNAALLNAALGHLLDFDDVSHSINGHPSVVLVPTIVALAEELDANGLAMLDAYAVGFAVACAVAGAFDLKAHYRRGWHSTSTLGVLGSAAASARLLELPADIAARALGIAASFAAGSRQNFGTTTKWLHAGHAAQMGMLAALFAAHGATGDPAQLEGGLGFGRLFGDGLDPHAVTAALAGPAPLLSAGGLNAKKYPNCYNSHRAIDATLHLRPQVRLDEVTRIDVCVEPVGAVSLIHHDPRNGLEAKFCGEYHIAAALLDGQLNFDTFTDAAVRRDAARALMARVQFREADRPPIGPPEWINGFAVVQVARGRGDVIEHRVDVPRGDARNPLDESEQRRKFNECLARSGNPSGDATFDGLAGLLRDDPVRTIFESVNPEFAPR